MVNLDNISYIEDSNGKKAVILSLKSFEKIRLQLEELEDIKSYITAKNKNEETLPIELVERLLIGDESKIKVMRQYRKYSVTGLANRAGITESYLSQIERGKRRGSVDIYKKLAKILDIDMELIV
jgi:DNA-binding XRE family transcriptional regulator